MLKIGTWFFLGSSFGKSFKLDSILKIAITNIIATLGTIYIIVFFAFLLRGMLSASNIIIAYISAFIFIVVFIVIHIDKWIKYLNIVRVVIVFNILFFFGFIYVEVPYGKIWTFLIPIMIIFLTNLSAGLALCAGYFIFILSMEFAFAINGWKLFIRYTCVYWSLVIMASAYEVLRINYNQKLLEEKEKMEILSITDHLTKLYNRRYFSESIDKEFACAVRQKESLSFLMIDADYFKNYNDTYGHLKGDELLISLAAIFKNVIKRPGDLVFRMGGEEFGILLPSTDLKGAFSIAEKVREEVQNKTEITVSIGVASVFPQVGDSSEKLLKLADSNLYRAKEIGRNEVIG